MKLLAKHIFSLLLAVVVLTLTGCKDDDLFIDGPSNSGDVTIDGDCLSFVMELNSDISTRSGDMFTSTSGNYTAYEDYIDTQDKFRIFFFTAEGDFLFGANDRVVGRLDANTGHSSATNFWYVRIPMTKIVDRDNNEYDIDRIKDFLKKHPFKIAVLANWPNGGEKINPADYDDSENGNSPSENPSSSNKGEPKWNWTNSILNDKANPADIRNINDLHHVYHDVYYESGTRRPIYESFMGENMGKESGLYMGAPTDWVKMRNVNDGWKADRPTSQWKNNYSLSTEVPNFSDKDTANQWIRANWTPEVYPNQNKLIYRHYQHLWFLWNFNATYKYGEWLQQNSSESEETKKNKATEFYGDNFNWNDGSIATVANPWGKEWYERNGSQLYDWMRTSYNSGGTARPIGEKIIDIDKSNSDVFFSYIAHDDKYAYCRKVGDLYGIQLPEIGAGPKTDINGMIKFQAPTSGTLRVKWGSLDDETRSGLAVQVGINICRTQSNVTSRTPVDWINSADNLSYMDINIEGDSQPVYIYCTNGKAVVYSIEFIRGRYLYETDREGIEPNAQQGIPMYGVQYYDPIPDWQRGTTFSLGKNVSLIRALAKVEVYIDARFGMPRHVMLRNFNRLARCEPMDVHTTTDSIWKDNHFDTDPAKLCEWFRIQDYGPSYRADKMNYSDWLGWLYGSWKAPDCRWKATSGYKFDYNLGYAVALGGRIGWNKGSFTYDSSNPSPRVFNPYYYRSSFCRMLYEGEEGGGGKTYHKFVMYVPEKNISDPSVIDDPASAPRVPHIEYRFDPRDVNPNGIYTNSEFNLDDNDCYRIYFTNYGYGGQDSDSKDNVSNSTKVNTALKDNGDYWRLRYDEYEKNEDHLKMHWPIMRNHTYKFYVSGSGMETPEIHVQVNDWGHKKVVVEW